MTPDGRLDRIERLAKLFVRAGRRARRDIRDQNDKINILIDLHLENEERFAKNEDRFARNEERFARNEERFAKQDERFAKQDAKIEMILDLQRKTEERFVELAKSQADLNQRFDSLITILRERLI